MYRKFIATALLLSSGLSHADGPADWKVYAFSAGKPQDVMFYLNSEIVRTPQHVQVWMKALSTKKLDATSANSPSVEKTVHLIKQAYAPPYGTVHPLTKEQVLMVTAYEQMADEADIPPSITILYEIDCAQKLSRVLSVEVGTPPRSDNAVHAWEHVPPETTLATLSKLTCKPS